MSSYATVLADRVSQSDTPDAIIGGGFIPGVGKVILFTDVDARQGWINHVGPLKEQGQFLGLSSEGLPISVVWGVR